MIDTYPPTPDEYLDYRGAVGPDRQLWENNGWSVRGQDGNVDFLFWGSPYLIQGIPNASYQPGRFAVNQTLLITHDAGAAGELVDNDFIAVGWDPIDYVDWHDVSVVRDEESVRWNLPERSYLAAPPHHGIVGTHAGVTTDLSIDLMSDPMWFTDPGQSLDERANRWWIANGHASGLLENRDHTLKIERAHAVHERHIHCGLVHDPVRLLAGGGVVWFTASNEDLVCAVLARPSQKSAWAQLTVDGRTIEANDADISFNTENTWLDPATGMVVAQAWRVVIERPDIRIELSIQAKARAYYLWNFLAEGSTMLYWWLCTASATIQTPGSTRGLDGLVAEAHLNRTFYRRHGARNG